MVHSSQNHSCLAEGRYEQHASGQPQCRKSKTWTAWPWKRSLEGSKPQVSKQKLATESAVKNRKEFTIPQPPSSPPPIPKKHVSAAILSQDIGYPADDVEMLPFLLSLGLVEQEAEALAEVLQGIVARQQNNKLRPSTECGKAQLDKAISAIRDSGWIHAIAELSGLLQQGLFQQGSMGSPVEARGDRHAIANMESESAAKAASVTLKPLKRPCVLVSPTSSLASSQRSPLPTDAEAPFISLNNLCVPHEKTIQVSPLNRRRWFNLPLWNRRAHKADSLSATESAVTNQAKSKMSSKKVLCGMDPSSVKEIQQAVLVVAPEPSRKGSDNMHSPLVAREEKTRSPSVGKAELIQQSLLKAFEPLANDAICGIEVGPRQLNPLGNTCTKSVSAELMDTVGQALALEDLAQNIEIQKERLGMFFIDDKKGPAAFARVRNNLKELQQQLEELSVSGIDNLARKGKLAQSLKGLNIRAAAAGLGCGVTLRKNSNDMLENLSPPAPMDALEPPSAEALAAARRRNASAYRMSLVAVPPNAPRPHEHDEDLTLGLGKLCP